MKPLLWLTNIFINTFGITQPKPETAERAARFIGLLLVLVVIAVTLAAIALRNALR
jgi:hypothetical protein